MNVVLSSVSGSPGVSVWSVLLAGLWPSDVESERVVLEADLSGGVMTARYGLGTSKLDLLLAAAHRWEPDSRIGEFATKVSDSCWFVPGPVAPERADQLWRTDGAVESVAAMVADDNRVWLCDVGRAHPSGRMRPLFEVAALHLLFTRGDAEELAKVPGRLAALRRTGAHVIVVVTSKTVYSDREIAEYLGSPEMTMLSHDEDLVADSRKVWSASRGSRKWRTWSSGSRLAEQVAQVLEFSPRGTLNARTV